MKRLDLITKLWYPNPDRWPFDKSIIDLLRTWNDSIYFLHFICLDTHSISQP